MESARPLFEDIAQHFVGPADPREQLDVVHRDQRDAEAKIRVVPDLIPRRCGRSDGEHQSRHWRHD